METPAVDHPSVRLDSMIVKVLEDFWKGRAFIESLQRAMSAKFNLRPSLDLRFKPDEAKAVMKEVVNPLLDTVDVYDGSVASELAQRISEDVVGRLKLETDRVKEEEALRPTTAASLMSVADSGIGISCF